MTQGPERTAVARIMYAGYSSPESPIKAYLRGYFRLPTDTSTREAFLLGFRDSERTCITWTAQAKDSFASLPLYWMDWRSYAHGYHDEFYAKPRGFDVNQDAYDAGYRDGSEFGAFERGIPDEWIELYVKLRVDIETLARV